MTEQLTRIVDRGLDNRNGLKHPNINIIWNGANEKTKKEAKNFINEAYIHGGEKFIPFEIPKTEKDKKIIDIASSGVDFFIKFFDGNPSPIENNRIHLLKPGSIKKDSGGMIENEFCDNLSYCVSIDRTPSDISTAVSIQHEILHLKSPKIYNLIEGEVLPYRLGLKIIDSDGKTKFAGTHEALIGEINYHMFKQYIERNPFYKEELDTVEKIKPWINEIKNNEVLEKSYLLKEINLKEIYTVKGAKEISLILESSKSKDYKIAYLTDIIENPQEDRRLVMFERSKEWKDFSNLAAKLKTASKREIINKWVVIDMFARVLFAPNDKFTQKLDALKKTVDGYLGKGAFEKIK